MLKTNRYTYTSGNPIKYVDIYGLWDIAVDNAQIFAIPEAGDSFASLNQTQGYSGFVINKLVKINGNKQGYNITKAIGKSFPMIIKLLKKKASMDNQDASMDENCAKGALINFGDLPIYTDKQYKSVELPDTVLLEAKKLGFEVYNVENDNFSFNFGDRALITYVVNQETIVSSHWAILIGLQNSQGGQWTFNQLTNEGPFFTLLTDPGDYRLTQITEKPNNGIKVSDKPLLHGKNPIFNPIYHNNIMLKILRCKK
jgi:hypothetical protein